MNILAELRSRFSVALKKVQPDAAGTQIEKLSNLVLPSQDTKFGDYQANCAMPLGKQLSLPPRQVAEQLLAALDVSDICNPPEIAGPGFINLRVLDTWLIEQLAKLQKNPKQLGIDPSSVAKTIYSTTHHPT